MKYITKINPDPGKKGYYNTVNKGGGEIYIREGYYVLGKIIFYYKKSFDESTKAIVLPNNSFDGNIPDLFITIDSSGSDKIQFTGDLYGNYKCSPRVHINLQKNHHFKVFLQENDKDSWFEFDYIVLLVSSDNISVTYDIKNFYNNSDVFLYNRSGNEFFKVTNFIFGGSSGFSNNDDSDGGYISLQGEYD